jgi:hypothetical protein
MELSIEDFIKDMQTFMNFLSIGIYGPTNPTKVILSSEKLLVRLSKKITKRKRIILHFALAQRDSSEKDIMWNDMLFSYKQIEGVFTSIIQKWYRNRVELEPVFNLLFEHFYLTSFNENVFLNLAQAAETLHARLHSHTKMPKVEYDEMKKVILAATPSKYHSWLKEQFSFGNNLTLLARLEEVLSEYSNATVDAMIGDKTLFVKQVRDSRNYYTHYSVGKKNVLKGSPLLHLTLKLKAILVAAILIESGFDAERVAMFMDEKKHRYFRIFGS